MLKISIARSTLRTLVVLAALIGLSSTLLTLNSAAAGATGSVSAPALTAKGPTIKVQDRTIYIPSDQGIRYYISVYDQTDPDAFTNVTLDGLAYAKPGTYRVENGLKPGAKIAVEAKPVSSTQTLEGTSHWDTFFPLEPTYNDDDYSYVIPSLPSGVGNYFRGTENTPLVPGKYSVYSSNKSLAVSFKDPNGKSTAQFAHLFRITPIEPQFDATHRTVKLTTIFGQYFRLSLDGKALINTDNSDRFRTGTYPIDPGELVVTAAADTDILKGQVSWTYTSEKPSEAPAPTFMDDTLTVVIPTSNQFTYYLDSQLVAPGETTVQNNSLATVEAKDSSGETKATWTHQYPNFVTPVEPTYDDFNGNVTIKTLWGMHFKISQNGTTITGASGSENLVSGTYGAKNGLVAGSEFTVTAESNGGNVRLKGTTVWTDTFPLRPSYSLATGDEFSDSSPLPNAGWTAVDTKAPAAGSNKSVAFSSKNVRVKDGQLEIHTVRHCLASGEDVSDSNARPDGSVCGAAERTVYVTGRISTGYLYGNGQPFQMEVRARMSDGQIDGQHFAAWLKNDQQYCTAPGVKSSRIAELDTMEVFTQYAYTTNTSHITCVATGDGSAGTKRDAHKLDGQIAGVWRTYKMVWDGKAIRYYFDGQLVPSS